MNPVCEMPEMTEVSAALTIQAKSPVCACGREKEGTIYRGAFCDDCMLRIHRVDQRLSYFMNRFAHFTQSARQLWLYDLCVDLLRDPNAGTQTYKPRKLKED